MTSLLDLKYFRIRMSQVKIVAVIAILTIADLTFLLVFLQAWNNIYTVIPASILTATILSMLMMNLTSHSSYDLGVLKALGAENNMIVASMFVELLLIGFLGGITGVVTGVLFAESLLPVTGIKIATPEVLNQSLIFLTASCIVGAFVGAFTGASLIRKKLFQPVSELIANAK